MNSDAPESTREYKVLKELGFTKNEIRAYLTILTLGASEAREICNRTGIPTSKIYAILDKLERFGLIEILQERPKKCRPVNVNTAVERMKELKRKEYEQFKEQLPDFKKFLDDRIVKFEDSSIFWNVAVNEEEIVEKHISRFQFVDFNSSICITQEVLQVLRKGTNMARDISMMFKNKKIDTKLLMAYQNPEQKKEILKWVDFRPRKLDAKNDIRLIDEFIQMPFGLFDFDKVLLLIRHPVNKTRFLSSIFMINRSLFEDLSPVFDDLWNRAEIIS